MRIFQARKIFFLRWISKNYKHQVENNSSSAKCCGRGEIGKLFTCQHTESWAVACHANIWRNELQGLSLMFLKVQKRFSVTLIKIRRKKESSHWNLQEKVHSTQKNDFSQSKSVQTYPKGSCSSFPPVSTPFVLCHLSLTQLRNWSNTFYTYHPAHSLSIPAVLLTSQIHSETISRVSKA